MTFVSLSLFMVSYGIWELARLPGSAFEPKNDLPVSYKGLGFWFSWMFIFAGVVVVTLPVFDYLNVAPYRFRDNYKQLTKRQNAHIVLVSYLLFGPAIYCFLQEMRNFAGDPLINWRAAEFSAVIYLWGLGSAVFRLMKTKNART